AQPACEREPVLAGESNIKQNQSRELTVDEPAQRGPAVDAGHTEIVLAEVLDQQLALGGLVLDRDDMWPVIRHSDLARIARSKHCRPCPVSHSMRAVVVNAGLWVQWMPRKVEKCQGVQFRNGAGAERPRCAR